MEQDKKNREKEFLKVFEANVGVVIKIAKAYTSTTHDREDLMNDILVELWRSFDTFRGVSAVSTWIYRVALNTSMNYRRKKKKHNLLFTFWSDTKQFENLCWLTEQDDTPETELLYRSIDQLDAFNKAIILLYLDRKTHEEIALILGISKSNVGTRIGRIKEQIKKNIHQQNG
ncbi:MAG: RNA polymerase sigma factor [Bacteroidetes bacterium]|nr:RNA polymerase sigma factor [Bacteroidota bacterium]